MAINKQFTGNFPTADGNGTAPDNNMYMFGPNKDGIADYSVVVSGPATLNVCIKDPSKLFQPDTTAPKGTNALKVSRQDLTTVIDTSQLEYTTKPAINNKKDRVPKILLDLCAVGSMNPTKAKATAVVQACNDIDPKSNNWSDPNHQPASILLKQINGQISDQAKINADATAIVLSEIDIHKMQDMEAAVDSYLRDALQSEAKVWADMESQKLGTTVQVPTVFLETPTGDLPKQEPAFVAKNPTTKNGVASSISTIILSDKKVQAYRVTTKNTATDLNTLLNQFYSQYPNSNDFPFYLVGGPNRSENITVTPVEQKQD
jgi:hypothetical protein